MTPALYVFLFSFVAVPIIDVVWIGFLMKGFYLQHLGHLARVKDGNFDVLLWPAVFVYIFLALGVTAFVIPKAESVASAFGWGALLGACIYGVYDFTNLSTLRDYPIVLTCVDLAWGTVLCGTVSAAAYRLFAA